MYVVIPVFAVWFTCSIQENPRPANQGVITYCLRQKEVTSFEQLPLALKADQVAAVLGISRAGAYNLMRSEGFPTLFIGKRMIVPKDKLIDWMDEHVGA